MKFDWAPFLRTSRQLQNRWNLKKKLSEYTMINFDVNQSIQTFVSKNGFESNIIPLDVYLSSIRLQYHL